MQALLKCRCFKVVQMEVSNGRCDYGKMSYGCNHYRRRCKIRAPCCNRIFDCRHCHNEAMSTGNLSEWHELERTAVKEVVCSVCGTEQPVARVCTNCGVNMGEYFCDICKFYDDDIQKGQFHCTDCGICRVGGRENFFHCKTCGVCYVTRLRSRHVCVENSMRHRCFVCFENLFDSLKGTTVMKCGHTMHCDCYDDIVKRGRYHCPICFKPMFDIPGHLMRIQ